MPTGYSLPQRRLVSQQDQALTERPDVPRSRFTGSWTRKTAFDAGYLVPILVDEVLPGDHLRYDVTAYVRMATPLFPMFDNQRIDTFFFFVPNRLLWTNWSKFMGAQDNPSDSIDYLVPQVTSPPGGFTVGGLFDHFGLPTAGQITGANVITINALPARAYNLIWNEWFRDQNVQVSITVPQGDGIDPYPTYSLQFRNKFHDYFTSALPWPQKFNAPTVPLGGLAPVLGLGTQTRSALAGPLPVWETGKGANQTSYPFWNDASADATNILIWKHSAASGGNPEIYADLSQATGVAINTLRQAWLIQSLLERDARGGTRYVEILKSHFGVVSPDFRLSRPELIGSGSTPLQLTPIPQTAPTTGVPVGALGAAGTGVGAHSASYAATEHGYIIGLINIRSELSYQQGIPRQWSRWTRYDFYWPSLAGLGEQAVLRKEIYATGVSSNDDTVFGYQERWHEYRARTSEVTGVMRSTAAGTLDAWHLAQRFTGAPTLSSAFLSDNPPMTRVLAAATQATNQQYLADILFQRTAVRPIPVYGTPVSLGRL